MPRIELDGLTFHYQQKGTGPDVVLVHAFTSNMAVWMFTSLVDVLAERFRVTMYDLRGHGFSDVPPSGYTSADMAGDLRKLHAALNLEPAWLVGHSFGGVIGMHAAVLYPEIVSGVILSDTYFPGLAHLEPNMDRSVPWVELRQAMALAGAEIGETVDFARLFHTMRGLTSEQHDKLKEHFGPPGARWLTQLGQLADTTAAQDAFIDAGLTAEQIASIRVPVVALYDEHTPFSATCEFLKNHLADVTVDIVPGATHLAVLQNSAAFVRLVNDHLGRQLPLGTSAPQG